MEKSKELNKKSVASPVAFCFLFTHNFFYCCLCPLHRSFCTFSVIFTRYFCWRKLKNRNELVEQIYFFEFYKNDPYTIEVINASLRL